MNYKVIIFIGALFSSGCGISQVDNYSFIRENVFDTSKYHLQIRDTNRVNKDVFESVFRTVNPADNSKLVLLAISDSSALLTEYGLYDFQSSKFYYGISTGGHLHLTSVQTPESETMYSRVKNVIQDPEKLLDYVKGNSPKSDQELLGVTFEASEILVDKQNHKIIIQSYHW